MLNINSRPQIFENVRKKTKSFSICMESIKFVDHRIETYSTKNLQKHIYISGTVSVALLSEM